MGVRKRPFEREDVVEHANVTYKECHFRNTCAPSRSDRNATDTL